MASALNATVSGGASNKATGASSTVPGGFLNRANGDYSFAAGRRAQANHNGSFVWSDSSDVDFPSTGIDQFVIEADGGVGIGTNAPLSKLHVEGNDLSLATSALRLDDIIVESSDAVLGLYSNGGGAWGSAITLKELKSDGTINNNWALARRSSNGDASFNITSGLSGDYPTNAVRMKIDFLTGRVGFNRSTVPTFPIVVGTNTSNGNGAHLTNGGIWVNGSDRNSKKGFEPIDKLDILQRVIDMPVTRWRYKAEPETVSHIGPVAQDFYTSFGTGESDRYIATLDAEGVALAAIQGLHEMVQDKDCEMGELRALNQAQQEVISDLQSRLVRIEVLMATMNATAQGGVK